MRRCSQEQRGETLIEILLTVFIMSTVLLSLLGLVLTITVASAAHRGTVAAGNQATTISETIDRLPYVSCGQVANYSSAVSGLESGYSGSVTSVRYLDDKASSSPQYLGWSAPGSPCPGGADQGAQLVTVEIQMAVPPNSKATVELVKRNDACPATAAQLGLQPGQKC